MNKKYFGYKVHDEYMKENKNVFEKNIVFSINYTFSIDDFLCFFVFWKAISKDV